MATRSLDVVILGGGNAGMGVTVATREAGLKVAMIEPGLLGGTCPNRGCMPKKALVAAAHALDEIERAKAHHISVGKPSLDWAALIDREKAMIAGIPGSLADLMNRRGVEVIRDRGRFAGPNAIAVDGEILEAKHIVIATGSKPRRLPFPGAELGRRAERAHPTGERRLCRWWGDRPRIQSRLRPGGRWGHNPRDAAAAACQHGCRCTAVYCSSIGAEPNHLRSRQSGTVISAPYRCACSAASGTTWWLQSRHHTMRRTPGSG